MLKSVVLLGEHDKGIGVPFCASTVSGRRLRALVAELGLICAFDNAFLWDGVRREKDLAYLSDAFIVALGRVAEQECLRQGIACWYLPHPACRSKAQLGVLRDGLLRIAALAVDGVPALPQADGLSDAARVRV